MESVVLLNADYTPLSVVKLRRAINLIVKKKAVAVEETTRIIQNAGCTFTLAVPRIIKLVEYVRQLGKVSIKPTKRNILLRDGYRCAYCGAEIGQAITKLTLDHIIPESRGGKTSFENCVAACFVCNNKKDNRTPDEAGMALRVRPYKPSLIQLISLRMKNDGVSYSIQWDIVV